MAPDNGKVNLSYEELVTLYAEQEAVLNALREQIRALERERDQALTGFHHLTEALRRRGCCDHEPKDGAF